MGKRRPVDDVEDVDEETVPVKRIRKLLAENRAAKQKAASAEKTRDDDEVPREEDATELVERGASSQAGAAKRFSANYMPLDTSGGKAALKRARKKGSASRALLEESATLPKSNVVYVGRIPHGFYEDQMRGFFGQFGTITRLRLSRNKKTGNSKHYAFVEFESSEVASIVADSMHNYLLFESMLQVKQIPLDKIHPTMWVGANRKFRPRPSKKIQLKRQSKARTLEEQNRLLRNVLRRDRERRKKLQASGIDFEFPALASLVPQASKKINFDQD